MIALSLEEFTAKRKKAQTDIEDALRSFVKRAVADGNWDSLMREVRAQYAFTYQDEGGDQGKGGQADPKWVKRLLQTLKKTKDDDKYAVERITVWLATAILTEATIAASADDPEDLFLEWVTMHDSHVRDTHKPANGQQRPIGEKFDVGGEKMSGPGDPTVSIDLWINCRCTLRPVLASEALVAAPKFDPMKRAREIAQTIAYEIDDRPWDGSASRFTPEQWKASCILHVCDGIEKSCHKLPIKEPGGALSRAGVHAAAGRIGSAQGPPEKIAAAKASLRGAYKTLGETPPDSLTAGGPMADEDTSMFSPVPWHGVLAPEGVWSGDRRRFAKDSLTTRDLPMPLTWQRASDEGHKGNIVIAKIEKTHKVDGELRATGHFINNPESDELIGMLGEFGKFGVSVDADEVVFDLEEEGEDEGVTFSNARVSSACVVPIPAFAQAFVALGEPPEDWDMGESEVMDEPVPASVEQGDLERFGRGPGWVTNPEGTRRLHDYWVHGEGAAKVKWGIDGDFNRCRVQVGEEIGESDPAKLRFINQICAQWHHDAKGYWPGRPHAGETVPMAADALDLKDTDPAEGIHLVASGGIKAPAAWFQDPGLDGPTPLTVTDDGRVFGHVATWDTCHIGLPTCTTAPRSTTDYAYFLTGQVPLDDGTRANTGVLSVGGGHAGPRLSMQAAIAHYDSTSTAVADITVGEDEHGIWMAGRVRPGATDEQVSTLMASKVSGDWRGTGREDPDLVAVLAVNVAGFPIPRTRVAASGQETVSLVAAGVVEEPKPGTSTVGVDVPVLAEAVAAAIEERTQRREAMAAIAARVRGEK